MRPVRSPAGWLIVIGEDDASKVVARYGSLNLHRLQRSDRGTAVEERQVSPEGLYALPAAPNVGR
jgi:hypothetical protein